MLERKISVIIPVYNQRHTIERCVESLRKQVSEISTLEIIVVNDGSTDGSGDICRRLAATYPSIVYINQENMGVSQARNAGLRVSTGKYIFYLDADDALEDGTIEYVSNFFDLVYDDVDLVTYRLDTIYNGRTLPPHFRYRDLTVSGVYDLDEHPYIGQTTMNIAVKNQFHNNVYFDVEQTFSEDQKYCCEVLKSKLKMGFCHEGRYIYYRSDESSSGRLAGACHIFEQCTGMFEALFSEYSQVPAAFQGLYVNDLYWKLRENILFPYHYGPEEYEQAVKRIRVLLQKCDDIVILEHPTIDFFEKYYLLSLKNNSHIRSYIHADSFGLLYEDTVIVRERSMEIVVTRLYCEGACLLLEGFLKSVFFKFYSAEPILCAVENQGELTRKLRLRESAHSYYLSHEKTQSFFAFSYECDMRNVHKLHFEVEVGGHWFPTHFYFMPLVPLSHKKQIDAYTAGDFNIAVQENTTGGHGFFCFSPTWAKQTGKKKEIWLYYDCAGLSFDNGLLQFQHDTKKKDNIERFYVVTDRKQTKYVRAVKGKFVRFGSDRHKRLLGRCAKVVTAYIEESNIIPYEQSDYKKFARRFCAEVIYLQHGVLHIIMPWKYSREKLLANRIVVSTQEEGSLYMKSGYEKRHLIKTGMPRLDLLSKNKSKKKILFAPSWRKYLVGQYVKHKWQPLDGRFITSRFYKEISCFLNSTRLHDTLKRTGWSMEVKLHPIFEVYQDKFTMPGEGISFINGTVNEGDYDLFITDFSSYAFDFRYMGIPVLYFIPDIEEFKCGMNGYRQLNYPESFWRLVVRNHESLVDLIDDFCEGGKLVQPDVHFFTNARIRESIYQEITQGTKEEKNE